MNFIRSKYLSARAEKIIPLGSQTFSKSRVQYPEQAPLIATRGNGGYIWDADGNKFIDLVGGLLPNILGYCDPDIDGAIRDQLERGISLSLATELEWEVAKRLTDLIPCAEMVRFGKTGSDVCSAAVRLARAYTGRDLILTAGYHGWHDWTLVGDSMRNLGAYCGPSMRFTYGDLIPVHRMLIADGTIAAVIVEPEHSPQFLTELRAMCDSSGTVLIFDEIVTWPRWGLGGAQKAYGVTPDLALVSKAIANGMPLSAIVGRKDIMRLMAPPDNIFFSGTFFGETLSLAAAKATIDKLIRYDIPQVLQKKNAQLRSHIRASDCGVSFADGPWTRILFANGDIKTLFMQEMIARGVLIIASNNLCFAHNSGDIGDVALAYNETFNVLEEARNADIRRYIRGSAIAAGADVRRAG